MLTSKKWANRLPDLNFKIDMRVTKEITGSEK
jgi:hypothetical protein